MNKPIDPISVRQARQGKPVLVILTMSLVLAVVAGIVLWGAIADDNASAFLGADSAPLQQTALDVPKTK